MQFSVPVVELLDYDILYLAMSSVTFCLAEQKPNDQMERVLFPMEPVELRMLISSRGLFSRGPCVLDSARPWPVIPMVKLRVRMTPGFRRTQA
jgi:hypothetical protein